jgi:hypothetical protein
MTKTMNQFARLLTAPMTVSSSLDPKKGGLTYRQDDGDYEVQHSGDDIDRFIGNIT